MADAFLLEQFEKHKRVGISRFRQGELPDARYHFLKAAEYLLRLAKQSEGKLRETRMRKARELIDLAKSVKEKRQAIREKVAARRAGKDDDAKDDVPGDWKLSEKPSLRFGDIAGLDDVKEQIRIKMIYPFTHPEKAKKYNVKTGGGILLYGPPGTGKTMLAKAVAGELDAVFFSIAPSEILNKWVGESEGNIRKLFEAARKCDKAIIFIDEVESLVPKRRDGEAGGVMTRVVPQILGELDGLDTKEGHTLMFIGATNEPWNIDYAMLRPGRLDEKVYIGLPAEKARRKILELNLKDVPLAGDVDFDKLADQLDGYSGADIAYLCRKVSEKAFRDSVKTDTERPIGLKDFQQVLLKLKPSVAGVDLDRFKKFRVED
ncbi:MAG: ATP-binding protein [Planctomycetota bacterium]|jgi:transitional endoplasmic reticulum ATPase